MFNRKKQEVSVTGFEELDKLKHGERLEIIKRNESGEIEKSVDVMIEDKRTMNDGVRLRTYIELTEIVYP